MKPREIPLFLRTVRHVPPAQIAHRLRLRTKRAAYKRFPDGLEERWAGKVPVDDVGWPASFEPIDWGVQHEAPQMSEAGRGVFHLVGETHDVFKGGWRPPERTQLFRYHLHYMEWAWPMAVWGTQQDKDDFAALWRSWRADTVAGRWDEWSPYVVSLRSWVLCGVFDALIRGTDIEDDVRLHLRACATFLANNLELDVGGNHLVKNLKSLVGVAAFTGCRSVQLEARAQLWAELDRQVLSDGGHYELSPSYHAQVLGDMLDIRNLSSALGSPAPESVSVRLSQMATWLGQMLYPDDSVPRLGDCTPLPAGLLDRIRRHQPLPPPSSACCLSASGYVSIRPRSSTVIIFDFGPPCPAELPAHAQADWGTFEIWQDGRLLISDPGVSTYVGPRRATERATVSHNTASLAAVDQTEVWGSFRAGRRHRPGPISLESEGGRTLVHASVDYLDHHHERTVEIRERTVSITDSFGSEIEMVQALTIPDEPAGEQIQIAWDQPNRVRSKPAPIGVNFGELAPARRVEATTQSPSTFRLELPATA